MERTKKERKKQWRGRWEYYGQRKRTLKNNSELILSCFPVSEALCMRDFTPPHIKPVRPARQGSPPLFLITPGSERMQNPRPSAQGAGCICTVFLPAARMWGWWLVECEPEGLLVPVPAWEMSRAAAGKGEIL